MVAFDPIFPPLAVDVANAVEMRIVAVVDLAKHAPVGLRLVDTDRGWAMQAYSLNRLVQKGFGCLRIPASGKAEIDQLAICVDGAPELTPFSTDTDIGFIHVPIDARPTQMLLSAFGQFRAELLHPPKYGRPINHDIALCKKIDHFLIEQRVAQVPSHRTQNDLARKTVMLEG